MLSPTVNSVSSQYEGTALDPRHDHMRPLVNGWVTKIESANRARSGWKEMADECMMFYQKSAAAMWDPQYSKKFWSGTSAPKFRITINKAFELVAIFGPNLMWDVPHRQVTPKRQVEIPEEIYQFDPIAQQMRQQFDQSRTQDQAIDTVVSNMMQTWLNYTPREQPETLEKHSQLAIVDALVKGRGVMMTRPFSFPASDRTMTGSFRLDPYRLLIDPDAQSLSDAKWISIRHEEPTWQAERRFNLPAGSLKGRATLESHWSQGERISSDINMHRVAGQTNDMIVWYEVFSKTGVGARLSGMNESVRNLLEETVGDYAYIAVSPSVPWPLNMPQDQMYSKSTEHVREAFEWPVPVWTDSTWPISVLDFYPNTDLEDSSRAWPIPPLAPAMGELKFLNFLIPWLCNRIYNTSRDFWLVAGPYRDQFIRHLQEGGDLTVIGTPLQVEDVRKAIQLLQHAETRGDAWHIVEMVAELFDKRTGLTEFAYGRNEGGTQNRTAEETLAKKSAVGVRPEHMQKQVVAWQSEIATKEAFCTRWFVKAKDVLPLVGQGGAYLWQRYIESTEVERVVRQMRYSIAASSIRRPNRDRDLANFTQAMQQWLPVIQAYTQQTQNYEPMNNLMQLWGELHDMDMSKLTIPPPQPDPQQQQMQQQQMQMEMAKLQADAQKSQMLLKKAQIDAQARQQLAQLQMQAGQMNLQNSMAQNQMQMESAKQKSQLDLMGTFQKNRLDQEAGASKMQMAQQTAQGKLQMDALSTQGRLEMDALAASQDLKQDQMQHILDMLQDREKHEQELTQAAQMGKLKLQLMKVSAKNGKDKGKEATNGRPKQVA